MLCGNCGAAMPEDALVCPQCGTKITGVTNEAKQGLSEKNKLILLAGAAVLCVVLIIAAVVFVSGKSSSGSRKDVIYGATDGSRALFFNVRGDTKDIDDVYDVKLSGDRTKAVYITRDDYTLFYIDNKLKPVKVADEVVSVQMSMTGDYFAYTTSDDRDSSDCALYLYNSKKNKSEKIASNVHPDYICVSPNGKTVAYVKVYERTIDNDLYLFIGIGGGDTIGREEDFPVVASDDIKENYERDANNALYLSISGKEGNRIGHEGGFPVAVSDDGKKFFYIKFDEEDDSFDLQFYNGKESTKIAGDVSISIGSTMYTDKDVSELIYYKGDRTYYFNTKKKEPQRANGTYLYRQDTDTTIYAQNPLSKTYNLDSLTNAFYYTSDGYLVWLSRDGSETVKVTSKWNDYAVSEDGRTLVYVDKGALYKAEKFSANAEPKQLCEDQDAVRLVTSSDLSRIYLITHDDELHYYRDKKHVVKISNDLQSSRWYVVYNELNQKVYFIINDNLYSAATNDQKKKVESDVEWVGSYGDFVLYGADDGTTTYLLTKKGAVKVYSE